MIGTACNVQERANELTESYDKAIADLAAKLEGVEPAVYTWAATAHS